MAIKWIAKFSKPLVVVLLVLGVQGAGRAQTSICPAQLGQAIDAIANRPQFRRSNWGILVETQSQSDRQTLYRLNSERYFIPASTAKLLTTAAALQKLGPQFRIRTSVYAQRDRQILRVVGRGDPSLKDAQLATLAQQLHSQGIRQVSQLIVEDGYFSGNPVNPNWELEDVQAGYGAPINSLILNQNAIDLTLWPQALGQPLRVTWDNPAEAKGWRIENQSITVGPDEEEFVDVGRDFNAPILRVSGQLRAGSEEEPVAVAIVDPAANFLQRFQQALLAEGISVERAEVGTYSPRADEVELAAVESPPLSELIKETNQESNNLYAEVLLRSLGIGETKDATTETVEVGLEVLKTMLTQLGVNPQTHVLNDGSGLSRHNLVSPEALVQTLRAIARSPFAQIYRASLPIAGVNGTLENRYRNTLAQGIVQAKTGTLRGVSTLAGYLNSPNYQPLIFSIMVNQSEQSNATQRKAIDDIVVLLTRLRRC